MTATFTFKPAVGGRDWFEVDSWAAVYEKTGLAPTLPGVRPIDGRSSRPPWPMLVHRSHLPLLGKPHHRINDWVAGKALATLSTEHKILRSHQLDGVAFIRGRRGALLADEPRVGKTATALFAHEPASGLCVVVGPVVSRLVWHEWAARRFGACSALQTLTPCPTCARVGNRSVGAAVGDRPSFLAVLKQDFRPEQILAVNPQVLFMSIALLPYWERLFDYLPRIGTLIVDEAHTAGVQNSRGRDMDSVTVSAWRKLATISEHLVALTGTPLLNRRRSLWALLDVLAPQAFGKFREFGERYCGPVYGAYGTSYDGKSNTEELELRLSEIMLRRTWSAIRPNLPPIERSVELVPLPDTAVDQATEIAARMRQKRGVAAQIGDLARLRGIYAKYKVPYAVKRLQEIVALGHSVVAWTWHREAASALCDQLRAAGGTVPVFGPIHGQIPAGERERIVAASQAVTPGITVATMGALATAVSLAHCSHEVFVELDWTPANITQAEMRPFDGEHSVAAILLVADCEPDRRLIETLLPKLEEQRELNLAPSLGDAAKVLAGTFQIDEAESWSLSELAAAVAENAEAYA